MSSKSFFRCYNEYGENNSGPCEYAAGDIKILFESVEESLSGDYLCPGSTTSGKICGCKLELITPPAKFDIKKITIVLAAVLLLSCLGGVAIMLLSSENAVLSLQSDRITLDQAGNGVVVIYNKGEDVLRISAAETTPSEFLLVVGEKEDEGSIFRAPTLISIAPGASASIPVVYRSSSKERAKGIIVLESNGSELPTEVRVIANHEPLHALKMLEKSSKILAQEK